MKIDARGLSCPQPLVMTMKAIEKGEKDLEILVDSMVCVENISRYATHNNLKSSYTQGEDGDFIIKIS